MRKLLLASAAVMTVGAGLTGYASAQELPLDPMSGKIVVQPATGGGANNNNNYQGTMLKGPVANPTPGSMVIHFYGRVLTGVFGQWSSVNNVGGYKLQPQGIDSYMRLYPGVDAMATNGLRYGASIELRENFGPVSSNYSSTGASGYTNSETVYVRRAFVYAGTDQAGIIRIGQGDGLISIYDNGVTTFQFLPTGNLNGGDLQVNTPGATQIPFAFGGQAGNEYGNTKLVYLSPQFAGFDVGLEYAPNVANSETGCSIPGTTCPALSSSPSQIDGSRAVNQFQVGARYQGRFSDVGVLAYAVYMGSGHVNYTGPSIANPSYLGGYGSTGQFADMSLGNFGLAVTYAGFTVGGNIITGDANGQLALKPKGGASQFGWLAGATYKTGPITVGIAAEGINSQGDPSLVNVSQRHEFGIDTGASYAIAPGLTLWAEYLYQQRHQGDFNFVTGKAGSSAYNNVQSQAAMLGAVMTW